MTDKPVHTIPEIEDLIAQVRARAEQRFAAEDRPVRHVTPPNTAWQASLHFQAGAIDRSRLLSGFGEPEPLLTWTDGTAAELTLSRPPPGCDVLLSIDLVPHTSPLVPGQRLNAFINQTPVAAWTIHTAGWQHALVFGRVWQLAAIPVLRLELPDAFSPASHGLSSDPRILGVGLRTIALQSSDLA